MSDFCPRLLWIYEFAVCCAAPVLTPNRFARKAWKSCVSSHASDWTPPYVDKQACVVRITHVLKLANARLPARLARVANQLNNPEPCSEKPCCPRPARIPAAAANRKELRWSLAGALWVSMTAHSRSQIQVIVLVSALRHFQALNTNKQGCSCARSAEARSRWRLDKLLT